MESTIINLFNLVGLALNIVGAFIMYWHTPKVNTQSVLYLKSEMEQIRKKDADKNKMIKTGLILIFSGIIFQIVPLIYILLG